MMAKDPENRPTANDILSMDSFDEKNKVLYYVVQNIQTYSSARVGRIGE